MLRIETGRHTAPILRVAVDKSEQVMATASLDKTVRLWSVADGKLLRTIRMPIGIGFQGAVYALAISPDGSKIVAGGWTGDWGDGWCLYEFEFATGRLVKHVCGIPHRINHMTYSPDGKHLAIVVKGTFGLRVYRTEDFSIAAEDDDFGIDSVWAEFGPKGRLLVTGIDGYLRLYDKDFKRTHKVKAPGGEWVVVARFSPDGEKIAVGYGDTNRVDVVSADTLELLAKANTRNVKDGHLSRVAWSADGEYLYAGGRYDRGGWNPIRRWAANSLQRFVEYPAVANGVSQILPLKDGRVIYIGRDPILGVINQAHRKVYALGPATADFRDNHQGFLVSADGATVEFAYERFGRTRARFSLSKRRLVVEPKDEAKDLLPFVMDADGLVIDDWAGSYEPFLNGEPIPLIAHELSNAMAIAPDGENFFVGTSWRLVQFDRAAKQGWDVRTPAEVWAINIAAAGRLVVAAMGDGTIRWYRRKDGQELLAFYPHRDGKRWIAWTPSGYYMASPGGDALIGWHVNRGTEGAPDFFPAARLRDHFYRPDVVTRVLATLDETEALKEADAGRGVSGSRPRAVTNFLPPVIAITSPRGGAPFDEPRVVLDYELRAPSGAPVSSISVLINGRQAARFDNRPINAGDGVYRGSFEVIVPKTDVEVSLIARNARAASEPSTVKLKWGGAKSEQLDHQPDLYVLAIGVSDYRNSDIKLDFAAQDAHDFVRTIRAQEGLAYGKVVVRTITDADATLTAVREGLEWIHGAAGEFDIAMVFVAGHGVDNAAGVYHFLPYDTDLADLENTSVPYSSIRGTLASIKALTYLFIDTCHSGDVLGRPGQPSTDTTRMINDLSSAENGIVVFASSTGEQVSYENALWRNGAFTEALVDGIGGEAALTKRDYITVGMLNVYVSERVQDLTGGVQTPTTAIPNLIPDMHIALRRRAPGRD